MPRLPRLAVPCLAVALAPLGASTASADPGCAGTFACGPGLTGPARLTATGAVELPLRVGWAGTLTVTGSVPRGSATISAFGRGPDGTARRISVPRDYRRVTGHVTLHARRAGRMRLAVPVARSARGLLTLRLRFPGSPYELYTMLALDRR